jgi:hypothetical protein
MSTHAERALILEMIEKGTLTPQEGARLIRALPATGQAGVSRVKRDEPADAAGNPEVGSNGGITSKGLEADLVMWKSWWIYPLWVGVALTVVGASLVYLAMQNAGLGLWFVLAWLPFFLGMALILIAWYSRTGTWLYLRVTRRAAIRPGVIAFGLPLPLGMAAWFLRSFGQWLPGLDDGQGKELAAAIEEMLSDDGPFLLHIDNQDERDRVEVWIG